MNCLNKKMKIIRANKICEEIEKQRKAYMDSLSEEEKENERDKALKTLSEIKEALNSTDIKKIY